MQGLVHGPFRGLWGPKVCIGLGIEVPKSIEYRRIKWTMTCKLTCLLQSSGLYVGAYSILVGFEGGILHCSILGSSGEKLGMYSDFYSLDLSRDYAGTHGCVKLWEYVSDV